MLKALQRVTHELDPENARFSVTQKLVDDLGSLKRFYCAWPQWCFSDSVWPLQGVEGEAELGSEPSTLMLPTEALHYSLLHVDILSA